MITWLRTKINSQNLTVWQLNRTLQVINTNKKLWGVASSISACGRLRGASGRHLAGVSAAHHPPCVPPTASRPHVAYEYEALWLWKYAPPRIWNMEEGVREARANGRSLIYESGAAPPPCHNRIPGARARSPAAARPRPPPPPPPPRAQSRFRWRVVRSARRRVRFSFRTSSERAE